MLLVQGDVVRFTLNNGQQPYRVHGCAHLPLKFWAVFDLDQDTTVHSLTQAGSECSTEDVLILVEWNGCQKPQNKRLVLILFRWLKMAGQSEEVSCLTIGRNMLLRR